MIKKVELPSNEIALRLKELYAEKFLSNSVYQEICKRRNQNLYDYFENVADLDFYYFKNAKFLVDILSDYLNNPRKIMEIITMADGWTVLLFQIRIQNSINSLMQLPDDEVFLVPVSDKQFFKKLALEGAKKML